MEHATYKPSELAHGLVCSYIPWFAVQTCQLIYIVALHQIQICDRPTVCSDSEATTKHASHQLEPGDIPWNNLNRNASIVKQQVIGKYLLTQVLIKKKRGIGLHRDLLLFENTTPTAIQKQKATPNKVAIATKEMYRI